MSATESINAFHHKLPPFGQRYGWGRAQWNALLHDAFYHPGHYLGRVMAYETDSTEGGRQEVIMCDGGQRIATQLLLVAAVRDVLAYVKPGSMHISDLDGWICPDTSGLQSWMANAGCRAIVLGNQGEDLPFVAVSPQYFDRGSFYEAVLPMAASIIWASRPKIEGQSSIPGDAKRFFVAELRHELSLGAGVGQRIPDDAEDWLLKIAGAALSFTWTYVPMNAVNADGAKEWHAADPFIVQRLVWRSQSTGTSAGLSSSFKAPSSGDEQVRLIRDLLLGCFEDEGEGISAHWDAWIPLTRATKAAALRDGEEGEAPHVGVCRLLREFLSAQQDRREGKRNSRSFYGSSGHRGGEDLQADFRTWFHVQLLDVSPPGPIVSGEEFLEDHDRMERGAVLALRQLRAFAEESLRGRSQDVNASAWSRPSSAASHVAPRRSPFMSSAGAADSLRALTHAGY